uniref:Apyrase n=1 Tax=Phlebotomus papatasi TaxID=29031 RepID=A0A1B0FY67_PHLPP
MELLGLFCVLLISTLTSAGPLDHRQTNLNEYGFEIVADFDKKAVSEDKKNTFVSSIRIGSVQKISESELDISFTNENFDLTTRYAYKGRGAELSELIFFNGKLYTFDDKSGIIFHLLNNELVPWVILGDGSGNETNGFKCEWATIKDNHIYVGSVGVENFLDDGQVENYNQFFVKKVSKTGEVTHENWFDIYDKIRNALNMPFPGFLIHEAVMWSSINQKWIFLPRKCSAESYPDADVDAIGCNKMIIANEDFSTIEYLDIQAEPLQKERGFSSFKFLPDSNEKIIVGLTTVENGDTINTAIIALDLEGRILYPETLVVDDKYEGLAFFKHVVDPKISLW